MYYYYTQACRRQAIPVALDAALDAQQERKEMTEATSGRPFTPQVLQSQHTEVVRATVHTVRQTRAQAHIGQRRAYGRDPSFNAKRLQHEAPAIRSQRSCMHGWLHALVQRRPPITLAQNQSNHCSGDQSAFPHTRNEAGIASTKPRDNHASPTAAREPCLARTSATCFQSCGWCSMALSGPSMQSSRQANHKQPSVPDHKQARTLSSPIESTYAVSCSASSGQPCKAGKP